MLIIFIYLAHLVNKTPALRTILSITTRRLNEGGGGIYAALAPNASRSDWATEFAADTCSR